MSKRRFNVSAICAAALEEEVSWQELKAIENPTMDDIVSRLRIEKRRFNRKYSLMGYKHGVEDWHTQSYGHMMTFILALRKGSLPKQGGTAGAGFRQAFDARLLLLRESDPDLDVPTFLTGWLEGAEMFRKEVLRET